MLALPNGGFVAGGQGNAASKTVFYPTVWTSDDGVTWEEKQLDRRAVGAVQWIARTAKGQLVAVGRTGPEQGTSAAMWTSGDGSHWRAVDPRAFAGARELHAVAANGSTLLAVGFAKTKSAKVCRKRRRKSALFRSTDGGRTWRVRRPAELAHAEQWKDVVTYRNYFVALGFDFAGCKKDSLAAAWTSPSGNNWTKVPGPFLVGSAFARGATIGSVLFAGGVGPTAGTNSPKDTERDAEIWSATPPK